MISVLITTIQMAVRALVPIVSQTRRSLHVLPLLAIVCAVFCGCQTDWGPNAVVITPDSLNFGEVRLGASNQQFTVIFNNTRDSVNLISTVHDSSYYLDDTLVHRDTSKSVTHYGPSTSLVVGIYFKPHKLGLVLDTLLYVDTGTHKVFARIALRGVGIQ
jgi:hypothetical protein